MSRRDVYVPIVLPADGSGGGAGVIFGVIGAAVLVALLVCVAVNCAHFSPDDSQVPLNSQYITPTAVGGGQR